MHNFSDKPRDMARSVLPSTSRHTARERKAASARRARRINKQRIDALARCRVDFDDFEGDLFGYRNDLGDTGRYWTDSMVQDRRDADKIGPVRRWAKARIERDQSLRDGDYRMRRNYFAGLLGATLPGRHALSHLEDLFGPSDCHDRLYLEAIDQRQQQRRVEAAERATRRTRLKEVLAGADAGRLNRRIQALTPPPHDTSVHANSWRHPPSGGPQPWLFQGDADEWLNRATDRVMQSIAFDALDQVHAEMFGF